MKSDSASGRKWSFCTLPPRPSPHGPPDPTAIIDCSTWNPEPSGSCSGSRNEKKRSRRYGTARIRNQSAGSATPVATSTKRQDRPARKSRRPAISDQQAGGAEVGLEQDQHHGERHHRDAGHQHRRLVHAVELLVDLVGEEEHDRDLGQLRRLHREAGEEDPTTRVVERRREQHRDQQQHDRADHAVENTGLRSSW